MCIITDFSDAQCAVTVIMVLTYCNDAIIITLDLLLILQPCDLQFRRVIVRYSASQHTFLAVNVHTILHVDHI